MNRTILLVDDDPHITGALRRNLKSYPDHWQIVFFNSAADTLEYMDKNPVHILFSDIRMPGKDGFHLLKSVMDKYPRTVRIIFSGHYQEEKQMDSIRYAHQFIAKPVESSKILDVINNIIGLQEIMSSPRIEAQIGSLTNLQTMHENYISLLKALRSDEPSMKDISGLIKKDVALTARVMQMVNSAFFGVPHRISNCEQAVTLLGLDNIRNLLLSIEFFSTFEGGPVPMRNIERLWEHSMLVAGLAGNIALAEGLSTTQADIATLGGMLHDIGKLVFLKEQEYTAQLVKRRSKGMTDELAIEEDIFACTHAEAGAYLLGVWGLEPAVIQAVRDHHQPERGGPAAGMNPALAIHVANYLINTKKPTSIGGTVVMDHDALLHSGLQDHYEAWETMASALTS